MKVDLHAHCYPRSYMDEIGRFGVGSEGEVGVMVPVWDSVEERIAQMDTLQVDIQVLSLSAPNVYFSDEGLSYALAQMTNDFLASIVKQYPTRFLCLAAIPLSNINHAMSELSRSVDKLKMDGIMLGTNINQRPLSDDFFLPFLEEVNRRKILVALHPMRSAIEGLMPKEDLRLGIPTNVGFPFETTRTVAQMTFKGIFERFPNLTLVLPHSGGAIPFLAPRWEIFYHSRPAKHPLRKLPNPPSYYLKHHYYDTALAYAYSSLRCTLDMVGTDHVVFGTDHPYTNDFRARETIQNIENDFGLTSEEKEKIFFKNAATLFPRLRR